MIFFVAFLILKIKTNLRKKTVFKNTIYHNIKFTLELFEEPANKVKKRKENMQTAKPSCVQLGDLEFWRIVTFKMF